MVDGNSQVRLLIWNSMLSADLSNRYYGELTARYQSMDQWAKIFVAMTSSTAVSGWAMWGRPGLDWVWQTASALATLVALALPILDPANSMKMANRLTGGWFSILKDYEMLWTQVHEKTEPEARKLCQRILEEEKRLVELESALKKDRRLARRCEDEVRRSRGLPTSQMGGYCNAKRERAETTAAAETTHTTSTNA